LKVGQYKQIYLVKRKLPRGKCLGGPWTLDSKTEADNVHGDIRGQCVPKSGGTLAKLEQDQQEEKKSGQSTVRLLR
jgi:hypothetical protein